VRDYAAALPKQLSLSVGEVVLLTNEHNGWFQGQIADVVGGGPGKSGWFPSICVAREPLVLALSATHSSDDAKEVYKENRIQTCIHTNGTHAL
jgi:hypothetical protein